MALNLRPHEYRRHPNTNSAVLIRTNPYVRLSAEGQPPMFIQDGRLYAAGGGDEIKEWPAWVITEVNRMSPHARKEAGLSEAPMKAR